MTDLGLLFPLAGAAIAGIGAWVFWPRHSGGKIKPPPITIEMKSRGTVWAKAVDGSWREVCDTCGGNCGQCGLTERLGNPGFSLDRIVEKTGMNNPVAGLPRP